MTLLDLIEQAEAQEQQEAPRDDRGNLRAIGVDAEMTLEPQPQGMTELQQQIRADVIAYLVEHHGYGLEAITAEMDRRSLYGAMVYRSHINRITGDHIEDAYTAVMNARTTEPEPEPQPEYSQGWIAVETESPAVGQPVRFLFADGHESDGSRTAPQENWNFRNEPENKIVAWQPVEPEPQPEPGEDDEAKAARRAAWEARRAARVARYEEYAANAASRSNEAYERSRRATEGIPFGQPILVGHHSEGMHRAALKRSHQAMDKSCEEQRKAEYWEQKAKSAASNRAIFSDDNAPLKRYTLRSDITPEERESVYIQMFGLRVGELERFCKGHVFVLLSERVQIEQASGKPGLLLSDVQKKLSEAPGEEVSTRRCETESSAPGGDTEIGREVCLLRGNDLRVFDSGSHQRGWSTTPQNGSGVTDHSGHTETGMPQREVSSSLLQLQLRERALGLLSSSTVIFGEPPKELRRFFDVKESTDATEKLSDKIERLEKRQEMMREANKHIRKGNDAALMEMGFSEAQITELRKPDFCGRIGFADYQLSNNNANINRLKKRLKQLESAAAAETSEQEIGAVKIVDNAEENRLQIFFPDKPSDEVRERLKGHGFRWCRTAGAWQRHRSNGAQFWAQEIAKLYNEVAA